MPVEPELAEDELIGEDAVEQEDAGSTAHIKPWDPKQIRITTQSFTLREVVEQINEKTIDLAPDFQRDYVWKARQRTRLIESILLGIPLPAFYFNQDSDGSYQVVDGVQRLSTVRLFMADGHSLDKQDLEYLTKLHGHTYSNLDVADLRRFRSTQIVVHVIEPQTPDEVKYDIFGRVNTLGSPLSTQEIRHAMSKDTSRSFLRSLAELEAFDVATGWKFWEKGRLVRNSGRMMNQELALRFCAFRRYDEADYKRFGSLDAFLVDFTKRLDGRTDGARVTESDRGALRSEFERAMTNAAQVLGYNAFRRLTPGQPRRGPVNRAVFESQAVALADYAPETLLPHKAEIEQAFRDLFANQDYLRAVAIATGDAAAVNRRLQLPREVLRSLLP
jgi:hypothetical protein